MTTILTEVGSDLQVSKSFKAGGTIAFNLPVKLSAAGVVVVGTATDSIGWAVPKDEIEAINEAEQYVADQMVAVKLKGEVMNVTTSAAVTLGTFAKGAAAGKYAPETTPATRTALTEGIFLESAAGADTIVKMVRL